MRVFILLFTLAFSLYGIVKDDKEHSFTEIYDGKVSVNAFFNQLRMPNLNVVYRSIDDCEENCSYPVITSNRGDLKRFSRGDNVSMIAKGRYKNIAYMQFTHTYGNKDNRQTRSYFIDNTYKQYPLQNYVGYSTALISINRDIYEVTSKGIYKNSQLLTPSLTPLDGYIIQNNPQGDIAVLGYDIVGNVFVSNTKLWQSNQIRLSEHGDRSGILAVYPKNDIEILSAVYKYVGIYNKGLMGSKVNLETKEVTTGWLFNSSKRNVGFDPEVYFHKDVIYVGAYDSSNSHNIYLSIDDKTLEQITGEENYPEHIIGFEEEELGGFLIGAGLAQYSWYANNTVSKTVNEEKTTYVEVDYDIGDALYTNLFFEGRFGNTNLTISYLKNRVEKISTNAKRASQALNFFLDFDSLIAPSSSLRLGYEKAAINGIASYATTASAPQGESLIQDEFESDLIRYYGKYIMKRGIYVGLEYSNFTAPNALGFSNSDNQIEYVVLDPNFEISSYALQFGYDAISYSRRYEVDLSEFYFQGLVGLGYSANTISNEIKQQVESQDGKSIQSEGDFLAAAEADIGYIWQQRFRKLRGLGYSVTAGVRAKGTWMGAGQSEKSETPPEANELILEHSRTDIWYGAYTNFNIMF